MDGWQELKRDGASYKPVLGYAKAQGIQTAGWSISRQQQRRAVHACMRGSGTSQIHKQI